MTVYNISLHHRLVLGSGTKTRITQDQPSHAINIKQAKSIAFPYGYIGWGYAPTFALQPESVVNSFAAYLDPDGDYTQPQSPFLAFFNTLHEKYKLVDGYQKNSTINTLRNERPTGKHLAGLMHWLDQLNELQEWGFEPLFKIFDFGTLTGELHEYESALTDTSLNGLPYHHVDFVELIKTRIDEIGRFLGYGPGKFYICSRGWSFWEAASDVRRDTDNYWPTTREEIGQYGKYTLAEYHGIFPGLMQGRAGLLGRPDILTGGTLVNSQGWHGSTLLRGPTNNQEHIASVNGIGQPPVDMTDLVTNPAYFHNYDTDMNPQFVGLGGNIDTLTWSTASQTIARTEVSGFYSYANVDPLPNPTGSQLRISGAQDHILAFWLGGRTIKQRYGYLGEIKSGLSEMRVNRVGNPLDGRSIGSTFLKKLNGLYKLELVQSDFTGLYPFPEEEEGAYAQAFYDSFTPFATIKEGTIDFNTVPLNLTGTSRNYVEDVVLDFAPLWEMNSLWAAVRLSIVNEHELQDWSDDAAGTGVGFSFYRGDQQSLQVAFKAKKTEGEEFYIPMIGCCGLPTNGVYRPIGVNSNFGATLYFTD